MREPVATAATSDPTAEDLMASPALAGLVSCIAGPVGRRVTTVKLVDVIDRLDSVDEGALVVLTEATSRELLNYRLDMALRLAGSSGAAGLVLTDGREEIPATAATIAERSGIAVLRAGSGTNPADIILRANREIAGGAEAALARAAESLAALLDAEARQADPAGLLEAVSQAVGLPFELRAPRPGERCAPVMVDEDVDEHVCGPAVVGELGTAVDLVVQLAAAAVARARASARQAEQMPELSRAELLTEFLLAGPDASDRLMDRLRSAGVAVDWWHAVIRIEPERDPTAAKDELASYQLRQRIARVGSDAARAVGGVWQSALVGPGLLLVRMERRDPGPSSGKDLAALAAEIVRTIRARVDDVALVCGIGTSHQGAAGLRASAAEAHAAVAAARTARRLNTPVSFDGVGMQRTVIEWYASDTAREMVDHLLEPIDRLGGRRAEEAIRTLQLYLDNQGSTARTAELMHLHRNAVAYRIKRIFDILDVDSSDPDIRLMLQLACRARSLRPQ
ncbi:MAG: helix-turn-helix domain-containing protein [Actinomycetota bacterium]